MCVSRSFRVDSVQFSRLPVSVSISGSYRYWKIEYTHSMLIPFQYIIANEMIHWTEQKELSRARASEREIEEKKNWMENMGQ